MLNTAASSSIALPRRVWNYSNVEPITPALLGNVVTQAPISPDALRDLLIATITVKYTQVRAGGQAGRAADTPVVTNPPQRVGTAVQLGVLRGWRPEYGGGWGMAIVVRGRDTNILFLACPVL